VRQLSYGELIRKIRLEKGFSQKEIYYDIVTKSYAIEFEKGNHDLSFKLLLKVLDRLRIDLGEFFSFSIMTTSKRKPPGKNSNSLQTIMISYCSNSYMRRFPFLKKASIKFSKQ
jgi:transcriptional regulator with XRE-family HTH domain